MATILLTWELGGGLGHLYPLSLLGRELVRRGHRVVAALRETQHAARVFAVSQIALLQAPAKRSGGGNRFEPPRSYAHLLHNIGFGDLDELRGLLASWDTIVELVRPDVVMVDHSPTALLALRGRGIATATCGIGFYSPPDEAQLPRVRPWERPDTAQLAGDEQRLLEFVNRVLAKRNRPPLLRLGKLFAEVDENLLLTFAELDHFGPRTGAQYWGCLPSGGGQEPEWPASAGPKLFAYWRPFPGLEDFLEVLRASEFPTICVCDGLSPATIERLQTSKLRLHTQPLRLESVARQCDLALTNASHGATAHMLLGGVPLLQVPFFVEQFLIATKVEQLGAGMLVPPANAAGFERALRFMLERDHFRAAAQAFASRYRSHHADTLAMRIVDRLERLLPPLR
jgi:hypothetical protein